MSLEQMGGASLGNPGNVMMQNLSAIQNNPVGILRSIGLNVPDNLSPQGIIDYLSRTGQIQQAELNRVLTAARSMGVQI